MRGMYHGMLAMERAFLRRWIVMTTIGELIGFTAPAAAGAATATAGTGPVHTYALMIVAGFVEGAVLGLAQASVLRMRLPDLPIGVFGAATGAAASAAYAVGMLPSTLGSRLAGVPGWVLAAGVVIGGGALLASIGSAQWLVLRAIGAGRAWWIGTTAGAWLAGLAVFLLVATPLWRPGQPVGLAVLVGLGAGALMAATVAVLTGLAAGRLVPDLASPRQPSRTAAPDSGDTRFRRHQVPATPGSGGAVTPSAGAD